MSNAAKRGQLLLGARDPSLSVMSETLTWRPIQEFCRLRVFLEDIGEVGEQWQLPPNERVSPEVARHQSVHDRATFAFDSRRLHH